MKKKLIMNLSLSEKRVAVIEQEQVVEVNIHHPNQNEIVGNIYYGRVTDVLPGMNAAFVDIGIGKNGYLHRDYLNMSQHVKNEKSISTLVHQGEKLFVQVMKEPIGSKGPKLSNRIELAGANIVYLPFEHSVGVSKKITEGREKWRELGGKWLKEDEGIVFRTSCEGLNENVVYQEFISLRERFNEIKKCYAYAKKPVLLYEENDIVNRVVREIPVSEIDEMVVDDYEAFQNLKNHYTSFNEQPKITYYTNKENIFSHYQLEQELEKAMQKDVLLENGASIVIEHTEAMTVIDVNTGKFAGKSNMKETVLKTNLAAASEIARQIRLRDIGGIIVIDFIDMKDTHDKNQVLRTLRQAFQTDHLQTKVLGFTGLGLVEISRQRIRPNLTRMVTAPCAACHGTGHRLSNEAISYKIERELVEYRMSDIEAIWIETSASVIACLAGEHNEHLRWLEDMLKFEIHFTKNDHLSTDYLIRHVGTARDVKQRISNASFGK